jgi:hypothetical protein
VHSGHLASASNGKTGFFEAFQAAAGEYVCKFGVEVLTTKQRADPGKPMPEYARWKGARVLYCSEPTHDDVLHSGILKDLTGGEQIVYRLLFSNAISCYRPMHKLHMMCNDKPKLNGGDSGVARRVRVVEYNSQFVESPEVDPSSHRYAIDTEKMALMVNDVSMRMAFLRHLDCATSGGQLERYRFKMPSSAPVSPVIAPVRGGGGGLRRRVFVDRWELMMRGGCSRNA